MLTLRILGREQACYWARFWGLCGMVWKIVGRLRAAHAALNAVSVSLVGIVAAALVVASLLAAFKVIPWPQIALFFGGQAVPQAGMWLQLGLTGLMLLLLFYLPANLRISRLERSHRSFAMDMHDVARAYAHAHAQYEPPRQNYARGGPSPPRQRPASPKKRTPTSPRSIFVEQYPIPHTRREAIAVMGLPSHTEPTDREIKLAFNAQALRLHPDKNAHNPVEAAVRFDQLHHAYKLLRKQGGGGGGRKRGTKGTRKSRHRRASRASRYRRKTHRRRHSVKIHKKNSKK